MAYYLINKFKSKLILFKFYLKALIGEIYHRRLRIIISYEKCAGNFALKNNPIYKSDLNSVKISRDFLFSKKGKFKQNFLDVGGGDGKLTYLLGMIKGDRYLEPHYKKNKVLFDSKFEYYGTDLIDRSIKNKKSFVFGDICDSEYLKKVSNDYENIYTTNKKYSLCLKTPISRSYFKLCEIRNSSMAIGNKTKKAAAGVGTPVK